MSMGVSHHLDILVLFVSSQRSSFLDISFCFHNSSNSHVSIQNIWCPLAFVNSVERALTFLIIIEQTGPIVLT